ncbi:MAG: NAD(P)/FAD-dependent oxidoreductase [Dysgonamonadaceae bacterium]|jgi:NADH dehydrogenase|nr:NAD(P)/FAD-dependent oxidoreductase [Dysgonamonadaceae bacterium]
MSVNIPPSDKKRIVVVGGGFAGLELVSRLKKSNYQVILVDKNNFYQFLPLIYQVATAGIEPGSILFPFRKLFHNRKDFFFRMAEVRAVNAEDKIIQTSIGKMKYDYLILAAGSVSNFFGNKNIEKESIPMKTVQEAMGLRSTLISNFERALTCASIEERNELLNIVIVGGGATGVEIAGALSEMKRVVFPKDYPDMNPNFLQIYLVEASGRLLGGMASESSQNAEKYLREMGVNVLLNTRVEDYTDYVAQLSDGVAIPTRSFIWVSGVCGTEIKYIDGDHLGRGKRIIVDEYNRVKGLDDIFCVGDQCIMLDDPAYPNGHPQLAQAAIQQANNLAYNLKNLGQNKPMKAFRYKDLGSMATVGRDKAVAEIGKFKFGGWFAWIVWLVVHLKSILGVRNKVMVMLNWVWNYFTYDRSLRFIVYAKKSRVVKDRERFERKNHQGQDLFDKKNVENMEAQHNQ